MERVPFFPMTEIKIIPFKESEIVILSRPLHNYIRKWTFSILEFIFQNCTRFGLEFTIQNAPLSDGSDVTLTHCSV